MKAAGARVRQRGKLARGELRLAIHQHHVAAHPQRWRGVGQFDGFFDGRGARHQRGAGQPSGPMQLDDGAVDPRGQPKIVGIEDKTAHWLSLSTQARR
jgi:hypothetical protein